MKKSIILILVPLITVLVFVVVNLSSNEEITGDNPPIPKITTDSKEIPIVLGSYAWKTDVEKNVDSDELIKNNKPVVVLPGTEIMINFNDYKPKPSIMNYGLITKGRIDNVETWLSFTVSYPVKNNTIKIGQDAGKGITIIHLTAKWDSDTKADYYIPIEVK